jgi:hypothetical protein
MKLNDLIRVAAALKKQYPHFDVNQFELVVDGGEIKGIGWNTDEHFFNIDSGTTKDNDPEEKE